MGISQPSKPKFLKIHTFSPTQAICISNESWNHSEFKFATQNMIGFEKNSKKYKIKFFEREFLEKKNFEREYFEKKIL